MKYFNTPFGITPIEETSELYTQMLSYEDSPVFLNESDPLVVAHLAAIAEAAKPKEVTMRQARLALLEAGLLSTVETAISSMSGAAGEAARIEWEYSSALKREQPLVAALAATLGLTSVDLDTLFLSASTK